MVSSNWYTDIDNWSGSMSKARPWVDDADHKMVKAGLSRFRCAQFFRDAQCPLMSSRIWLA